MGGRRAGSSEERKKIRILLLLFLSWLGGGANSQKVVTKNLTCYKCFTNREMPRKKDPCVSFNETAVDTETCGPGKDFCQVKRHELTGQIVFIERYCTAECTAECIIVGDGVQKLTYCFSCCQTNLCNTDNSAVHAMQPWGPSTLASAWTAATCLLICRFLAVH